MKFTTAEGGSALNVSEWI